MKKRDNTWEDAGIRACNDSIAKDIALITGCCALVAVSAYGVINFSQELIDYINSGNIMDLKMKIEESVKIAVPITTTFLGGAGIYASSLKLKEDRQFKKKKQKELDSMPIIEPRIYR